MKGLNITEFAINVFFHLQSELFNLHVTFNLLLYLDSTLKKFAWECEEKILQDLVAFMSKPY